jgi:hypothetical protein
VGKFWEILQIFFTKKGLRSSQEGWVKFWPSH